MDSYQKLRAVNVNDRIEKKNGLSYLSWAFAVDTLLQHDPSATWTYAEPKSFGDTLMVFCTVTAFGKSMTAQLPVMDHRNKAIANPDAFAVNTAMQRCLAKAIALHGLGLYIYAGEDLPESNGPETKHDPRGDLGKDIPKLQAEATAQQMFEILEEDVEDEFKLPKVAELHFFLNSQPSLYTAAGDALKKKKPHSGTYWKDLVHKAIEARRDAHNGRA